MAVAVVLVVVAMVAVVVIGGDDSSGRTGLLVVYVVVRYIDATGCSEAWMLVVLERLSLEVSLRVEVEVDVR